jgi:hypothetical protein
MLLAVSVPHALAQNAISLGQVLYDGVPVTNDSVPVGVASGTLEFQLRIQVDAGVDARLTGTTNGFRVYSTGPSWTTTTAEFLPEWNATTNFDLLQQAPEFGATGNNDTVAFESAVIFGGGAAPGYSQIGWSIKLQIPVGTWQAWEGEQICIDSVSFYGPAHLNWLWNDLSNEIFPDWDGPHCVTFADLSVPLPFIDNAPYSINGSHCDPMSYTFHASTTESDPVTYLLISGPGQINATTGEWTYLPALADVGQVVTIQVAASNGQQGPVAEVSIKAYNDAPVITNCPASVVSANFPGTRTIDLNAEDSCPGDPQLWSVFGSAAGSFSIGPTGILAFTPAPADDGTTVDLTVLVSDGKDSSTCEISFEIIPHSGDFVRIEKDEGQTGHGALQGQFTEVDVFLDASYGSLGAFNFLIAYDPTALNFTGVETDGSVLYENCEWEYLQYRLGPNGNCGGACPTGMVRIVGFAETNNGAQHPVAGCNPLGKMFSLQFLVSNDRTLECQFVPIRFSWFECGDNTLANELGDTLKISRTVHDYQGFSPQDPYSDDIGPALGFPSFQGHPAACETSGGDGKPSPVREIDFFNGGVDIICANEIDARGDINLDGLPNTIADVVILTNYFVRGLLAFSSLPGQPLSTQGAIAASDVNADGLTLTVGDLVYLIRVVVGDAVAFPRITPVHTEYEITPDNRIIVNQEMGAAFLTVRGNALPRLLANNMTMEYAYDADNDVTRILVYSGPEVLTPETFAGPFVDAGGEVLSLEMALYDGTPVAARVGSLLPDKFALEQNYPNPFNPSTTIEFTLPVRSDYDLVIYNSQGQEVNRFAGTADAGTVEIVWQAGAHASGMYLYKLTAGDFSATKKMVLLK